jgi:CRP-like cAMP-binding protein
MENPSQFIQAIKRVPLFHGLKTDQAVTLIKISERLVLEPRTALCHYGDPSQDMYILLSGRLSVRTAADIQVATIEPIAPVGEMGLITGEPRSATVIVSDKATLLIFNKLHFDNLMRRHPDIELTISRNLITTLSHRLRAANNEIAHLQSLIADKKTNDTET